MFMSHKDLNCRQLENDFCFREEEWKRRQLVEEEARSGTATAITAYEIPLTPVTSFKYLGIFLSESDDNWLAVVRNLSISLLTWPPYIYRMINIRGVELLTWIRG